MEVGTKPDMARFSSGDPQVFKYAKYVGLHFGEMCVTLCTRHPEYFHLIEWCSHCKHAVLSLNISLCKDYKASVKSYKVNVKLSDIGILTK